MTMTNQPLRPLLSEQRVELADIVENRFGGPVSRLTVGRKRA
jgi:hypothetical protein